MTTLIIIVCIVNTLSSLGWAVTWSTEGNANKVVKMFWVVVLILNAAEAVSLLAGVK